VSLLKLHKLYLSILRYRLYNTQVNIYAHMIMYMLRSRFIGHLLTSLIGPDLLALWFVCRVVMKYMTIKWSERRN